MSRAYISQHKDQEPEEKSLNIQSDHQEYKFIETPHEIPSPKNENEQKKPFLI